MNWTKLPGFLVGLCISGLIWTLLPTTWILFLPVAVFWLATSMVIGAFIVRRLGND